MQVSFPTQVACTAQASMPYLAEGLIAWYRQRSRTELERYSTRALARVWKAKRFSWWMTKLLHNFPDDGAFGARMQGAELEYLVDSKAAMTALAENYVGRGLLKPS